MRKIKKYLIILVLCLSLVILGCSSKNKKDDTGERRETNHFSIEIEKAVCQPALKDDQLITLNFNVENSGETDFAIGASDFYIKDSKDNEYKIKGNHQNFGDDVKKGSSLKGKGFYQLPESETTFKVVYKPFKTIEAEWCIVLPKK